MKNVFIFGSLNMDLVIASPREVLPGETVRGGDFMTNGGGKGANQAIACAKLGAKAFMGGCVGNDGFGETLVSDLEKYGVDTSCVRRIDGVPTGVAVILIVDHDNRIVIDSGANGAADPSDADRLLRLAGPGDFLLVQLENRTEVVGYALKEAKKKGMTTVLNPAPIDKNVAEYFGYVDYLVPNEREFSELTGTTDMVKGAEALTSLGVGHVIVTLGSRGYCRFDGHSMIFGAAVKATAVDTTAAGDTFCGAFVTKLACGESVDDALRFANRAAAIAVTRKGAGQSVPTLREIYEFYG